MLLNKIILESAYLNILITTDDIGLFNILITLLDDECEYYKKYNKWEYGFNLNNIFIKLHYFNDINKRNQFLGENQDKYNIVLNNRSKYKKYVFFCIRGKIGEVNINNIIRKYKIDNIC